MEAERAALQRQVRLLEENAKKIAAFMHHHHHDSAAAVPPPNGPDAARAHPSSPSSLLAEYQSLQSRHFDCTVALSASQSKLDSAKALVLALHAERQELIEWRQRKRAQVRTLQDEGRKYYKLWKRAAAAAEAAVPAPLQPQPQSQPQLLAHDDSAANSARGPAAHANGAASAGSAAAAGARAATATGQRPCVLISAAGSPAGTGAARLAPTRIRISLRLVNQRA